MKKCLSKLITVAQTLAGGAILAMYILAGVLLTYGFLKNVIEPLSPIITALVVLTCTIGAMTNRQNTMLVLGGLILFGLSWPVAWTYGPWIGQSVWALGVLMWVRGVYCAIMSSSMVQPAPALQSA